MEAALTLQDMEYRREVEQPSEDEKTIEDACERELAELGRQLLNVGIDPPVTTTPPWLMKLGFELVQPLSTPAILTETGRRVALCLLSHVIANVPVSRCSIVRSVQRANEKEFSAGELVLLACIKIPCAIDFLVQELPVSGRTRTVWRRALDKAVEKYKANCIGKSIDQMSPIYRQHKHASALSRETSSGLLWMQKKLATYKIAQFHAIVQWAPEWHMLTLEKLANELKNYPFGFKTCSLYKRVHTVRSVVATLGHSDDEYAHAWLKMSDSNDDALTWMYPDHIDSPAKAVDWIHSQCVLLAEELSDQETHQGVLDTIKNMSRGDEACFRCEFKKVHLSDEHIQAMESAISDKIGVQWRYRSWGKGAIKETVHSGAFINGTAAADVLVVHMKDAKKKKKKKKKKCKDPAYVPSSSFRFSSLGGCYYFL